MKFKILLALVLFCFTFSYTGSLAKITSINGIVITHRSDSFFWEEVGLGEEFFNFDELTTTTGSYCELTFRKGHILRLDPNSKVKIKAASMGSQYNIWQSLRISFGKIWIKIVKGVDDQDQFFVETPYVSIAKQKAFFSVSAPYGSISTYEGHIKVKQNDSLVSLGTGYEVDVNEQGILQDPQPLSEKTLIEFQELFTKTSIPAKELKSIYDQLLIKRENMQINSQKRTSENTNSMGNKQNIFWDRIKNLFKFGK